MFVTYDGSHSITFGTLYTTNVGDVSGTMHGITRVTGKNTWTDWHLVPSSRPVVNPPAPAYKLIDIPGVNGTLDLSRVLTGRMKYQNRTGSWEFILDHDQSKHWETAYREIMGYLHGRSCVCVLEDDPTFYYEGNFSVNSPKSDKGWNSLTIDYNLYPFKRYIQATDEPWLWDPFNFETDMTNQSDYTGVRISANSSDTITVQAFEEPVKPEIYCSTTGTVTLTLSGITTILNYGWNKYPGIILARGNGNGTKDLSFQNNSSGTVTVGVRYRGGEF